jgi:hypothetical protein
MAVRPPPATRRLSCRSSVVEHSLGKGEVDSSILPGSTSKFSGLTPICGSPCDCNSKGGGSFASKECTVLPQQRQALSSALVAAAICLSANAAARAVELRAGNYSFSDELGGFKLISVSGTGLEGDPIVVVEELYASSSATLTIRRLRPNKAYDERLDTLDLVKVVINRTNRTWTEFEMELQEILHEPSVYSDGLSFNQFGAAGPQVRSDSFAKVDRIFEPRDRMRFHSGRVAPESAARFTFTITDPTPTTPFYLVQEPTIVTAMLCCPKCAPYDSDEQRAVRKSGPRSSQSAQDVGLSASSPDRASPPRPTRPWGAPCDPG